MIVTTAQEILHLRRAGRVTAKALNVAKCLVQAGMSTAELDKIIEDVIRHEGCKAAFKKVAGYAHASCISIGPEVVHGVPDKNRIIQPGDLVSIDTGAIYNGYYSDAAISLVIPPASEEALALVHLTESALRFAIQAAVAGGVTGIITRAIVDTTYGHNANPIKNYAGHGVGTSLHEGPTIPNYSADKLNPELFNKIEPGMVLAIEPMITLGTGDTEVLPNGWTVVTTDRKLAAHAELTILVTEQGIEILSKE